MIGHKKDNNMFKSDFKYYKSKNLSSFENVLNFNLSPEISNDKIKSVKVKNTDMNFFGLKPIKQWDIFELTDHPGFIFINNPFTSLGQRYWIVRSLKDYPNKPNNTNLDAQNILPQDENWWNYCKHKTDKGLLRKLRWATLGYHHNWDTKVYSDDLKGIFPIDLGLLCNFFAKVLGFEKFSAEAAIVNYYYMDSTLSGHTDHSEQNLEAPLFSFSYGQTALFLLGGKSIDTKPTAMFLQSGDVVIMSKESRLSYHGVPKILICNNINWNTSLEEQKTQNEELDEGILDICYNEELWRPFDDYLKYSRININVRQVLNEGQLKLK